MLLLLAGCEQTSVGEQEQIAQRETVLAGTPSPTPTPSPTLIPSATIGPSPTSPPPTATPIPSPTLPPSPTSLPPTPTTNPALRGFSYCNQQAGDTAGGRFSAQLTGVRAESFPAFERVTLAFTETLESAALSASANCLSERDYVAATGEALAPGAYLLQVQLPDWLHDEAFRASTITQTLNFTNTRVVSSVGFRYPAAGDSGATVEIPIKEPLRFKLSLTNNPTRLVVEIARASELVASSDVLSAPLGDEPPQLAQPVFFLLNGDIWRSDQDGTRILTQTAELETSLAVSPDGQQLAFCRTGPGADPANANESPGDLWTMAADGKGARLLARVGFNCADPAFSLDGSQVAWSVDETGVRPALRAVWVVQAGGGRALRVSGEGDEWSRSAPQWLEGNTLVYAADSPDGRSTLFLRPAGGGERDIGAELVVGERYARLGRPLAARNGKLFAVEAQRVREPGSDLVLIDAAGAEQEVVGEAGSGSAAVRPYWIRPLAWGNDGSLLYLTSDCLSTLVQNYSLHQRSSTGNDQVLASGTSLGALGSVTAVNGGITYVLLQRPSPGARGPLAVEPRSPSALWLWDFDGNTRSELHSAERAILALER
jgi:hypothetical protein